MNRQFALIIVVILAVMGGATAVAQQHRPYNLIMKDVGATFASLKKNLDGNTAAGAAEDAAKLEGLFKETEEFWAPLKTKDAVDYAKEAREAAAAVGAAAKGNDIKAAQASYGTVGGSCKGCHFTHREETGTGFFIKP